MFSEVQKVTNSMTWVNISLDLSNLKCYFLVAI